MKRQIKPFVKLEVLSNVYEYHVQARITRVKSFLPWELSD